MDYRKVATRILFYSLGIAAFAGILTIVLPNTRDVIGRLIATSIITAITAALLLFAIQRLQVMKTRAFGASMGIVTCCTYLLTISSIWISMISAGSTLTEKLGLSALLFAGCGALISFGFLGIAIKRLRLASFVLLGIWSFCLMAWLIDVWFLIYTSYDQFIGYVVFPLQTLFAIIVLCFIRRPLAYMLTACTFAIASCLIAQIAMFMTLGHIEENETLFILILISGGIGGIFSIANIIQYRPDNYAIRWAEIVTLVIVTIAITTLCINIWFEMMHLRTPDLIIRIAVGTGILSSTTILGLLVWQMLRASVFTLYDGNGLQGICPRCKSTLQIPRGKSHCATCGLRIKVQIESPNCRTCGYDITKTSEIDSCPECGVPIALSGHIE